MWLLCSVELVDNLVKRIPRPLMTAKRSSPDEGEDAGKKTEAFPSTSTGPCDLSVGCDLFLNESMVIDEPMEVHDSASEDGQCACTLCTQPDQGNDMA